MALPRERELDELQRLLRESADDAPPAELRSPVDVDVLPPPLAEGCDLVVRDRSEWLRLGRYRLPWTADRLAEALSVVLRFRYVEAYRVRPVLKGAAELCADGRATVPVVTRLEGLLDKLRIVAEEQWEAEELVPAVQRVLASVTPPELVDLSLLQDGDDWVVGARAAVRDVPPAEAAPIVRQLSQLAGRRPTAAWSRTTKEALTHSGAQRLLRRWLELGTSAQPVPEWPDSRIGWCRGVLFMGPNLELVRASVWATTLLPGEAWPAPLLASLAIRGAAHNGMPGMPEALALPVASAAVAALVARGGPGDLEVLGELASTLERRDLLKRIGRALGPDAGVEERAEQVRRDKARAQRSAASAAPRKARSAMDVLLRRTVGRTLRELGFTGGPRTWRRERPDRVEVVAVVARLDDWSGRNLVSLDYGARFDAAHPAGSPREVARSRVRDDELDLRLSDQRTEYLGDPDDQPPLGGIDTRLRTVVVPLLDSLDDWSTTQRLMNGDGLPADTWSLGGSPGSPVVSQVLGLLALARADLDVAVPRLEHAVRSARSWHAGEYGDDRSASQLRFWEARLEEARRLR